MSLSRRKFLTATAATALVSSGGINLPFASGAEKKKKLVLIAGTPSHGPGDHEFNAGVRLLNKCLQGVEGLETVVFLNGYPKDDSALDSADAILCYADGGGNHPLVREKRLERIGKLMAKGVGLMCAHYGVEVPKDLGGPEFKEWIGGYYESLYSCNPMWAPEFKEFPKHPIANGVKPFTIKDEWYFNMRFRDDMKGITPILSAAPSDAVRNGPYVSPRGPYKHIQEAKGRAEAMMWALERKDGGRGVGFTGGHFHRNWKDDNFRKVVLNALLWICKLDVPADGVKSEVTDAEIGANWDEKGRKK
ncbi:ThuA domain-containing protein [Gemmata sp. JC717]|uniref:ThuA domain-containing protein n=1 Tax=Gemmata algarum TaxID=2975278 RepID=A0ABU5EWI1_9BACT|nr:ThuA domain-containing protein [Gemmata algarum]MDY3552311.1 ThuA domain-containing protein [Gemmata algarum]MDY3559531.1 ThuA domain-containing protein [Gemmata algarum]